MIDCDVHQNFFDMEDLLTWVDPAYRRYIVESGFSLPGGLWLNPHGLVRDDAVPPEGGGPDAHYELMRTQLLEPFDVEYAIINVGPVAALTQIPNRQLAAALATAWNRWLVTDWLPRDKRFKGSIMVATQDAERAAEEIRVFGQYPEMVQVLLQSGATASYGQPQYHPIYEAAVEMGLPIGIHVGGEGAGINPPPSGGYPTYYIEWHTLLCTTGMAHLVSLICHGVFEKYRELRVAMIETGFVWLPGILWRLDANWKALRSEVPWVKRLPSETVQDQMRFTTQPLEQPRTARQLRQLVEAIGAFETMLMYASDYPHWDAETREQVRRLPASWQKAVLSENARAFYNLPSLPEESNVTDTGRAR